MFNPLRTFGFLLKDVSDRYMQRFEERAGALGLTLPQCRVIVDLVNHEGISQSQLAELTDIEPMTLVRILDRMESDGCLERRNDPTDRRAHCIYPRAKSKALVDDIWYLADQTHREAFAGIPSTRPISSLRCLSRSKATSLRWNRCDLRHRWHLSTTSVLSRVRREVGVSGQPRSHERRWFRGTQ